MKVLATAIHVTMNDALGMCCTERIGNLNR